MALWYSAVYKSFIAASIISFIISFFSQGKVSLGSTLAGYCLLILAIMLILVILFNSILKIQTTLSTFQLIIYILMATGPFLLMLGTIGFLMYLTIFYMSAIIAGQVSPNYSNFSNIVVMLLLVQIYIIYQNITNSNFISTGKLSKITLSLLYLVGVINALCSLILFTLLKYFRTDG